MRSGDSKRLSGCSHYERERISNGDFAISMTDWKKQRNSAHINIQPPTANRPKPFEGTKIKGSKRPKIMGKTNEIHLNRKQNKKEGEEMEKLERKSFEILNHTVKHRASPIYDLSFARGPQRRDGKESLVHELLPHNISVKSKQMVFHLNNNYMIPNVHINTHSNDNQPCKQSAPNLAARIEFTKNLFKTSMRMEKKKEGEKSNFKEEARVKEKRIPRLEASDLSQCMEKSDCYQETSRSMIEINGKIEAYMDSFVPSRDEA